MFFYCSTVCSNHIWYLFVIIDLIIYVIGWIIISIFEIKNRYFVKTNYIAELRCINKFHSDVYKGHIYHARSFRHNFDSIQLLVSHWALFLNVVLNIYIFISYIVFNDVYPHTIESCCSWENYVLDLVHVLCHVYFLLIFILRYFQSEKLFEFWSDLRTIIDIFTIPNVIVSLILGRGWYGIGFIRICWIMYLPDILCGMFHKKSVSSDRLWDLLTVLLCVWTCGAGIFVLIENSGDFFKNYRNSRTLTYGDSMYYSLVTMSTVGYGDISPVTTCGKIFCCIYIFVSLGTFASYIPELMEILTSRSIYSGSYIPTRNKEHLVICGTINDTSMQTFIEDFFHPDRDAKNIRLVLINFAYPNTYMKALLRRYRHKVHYYVGTVMKLRDLRRVRIDVTASCLIVSSIYSSGQDEDSEDASNIMRVISIKDFCPIQRILIQIHRYYNKINLYHIPGWNSFHGDEAICFDELKLGLLSRSSICVGFSTVLSNLITVTNPYDDPTVLNEVIWFKNYARGLSMEFYREKLSRFFWKKTFLETAKICLLRLNLMLICVEIYTLNSQSKMIINPSATFIIPDYAWGYFICVGKRETLRASFYCDVCHFNINVDKIVRPCRCFSNSLQVHNYELESGVWSLFKSVSNFSEELKKDNNQRFKTGKKVSFEDAIIKTKLEFESHVVLCVLSKQNSKVMGLVNFIKPLRIKNDVFEKLRPIIIIGTESYLRSEWEHINIFSEIYLLIDDWMLRRTLDLACVDKCRSFVIVRAPYTPEHDSPHDLYMIDKEVILTTLRIDSYLSRRFDKAKLDPIDMPQIITDVAIPTNMQYLYPADADYFNMDPFYTQAFASGHSFTHSVLDSLMSTTYFNPNAVNFIRAMIEGTTLLDSDNFYPNDGQTVLKLISPKRYKKYDKLANCKIFQELFLEGIEQYDIIIIGLYRIYNAKVDEKKSHEFKSFRRIVLIFPELNLEVVEEDWFFALITKSLKRESSEL